MRNVGLDAANQSANVLNPEVINDLLNACDEIKQRPPPGLIIHSAKRNGFIAGADINGFVGVSDKKTALPFILLGHKICDSIEALPFPTLALINRFCLGGGLELALACDYIIATKKSKTRTTRSQTRYSPWIWRLSKIHTAYWRHTRPALNANRTSFTRTTG
jgi:3-hydroxyacyl-CoA dehydrogenase/enoyl-CoA hydratase/3-hydroxybutyryl-CoA epimerase